MKYRYNQGLSFILIIVIFISCRKEIRSVNDAVPGQVNNSGNPQASRWGQVENDMVMYWNEKVNLILGIHTNPGADSRHFAMIQIAIHDALNSIIPKYACYAMQNERDQFANPDAAVASAAYWTIKGLNIERNFPVAEWYNSSLALIEDGPGKEQGKILGKKSSDAILANRVNDGLNLVLPTSPFPLNGTLPGEYRSTLPYSNPALNLPQFRPIPNWGIVMRPFLLQNNSQFRPGGPNPVNSDAYTIDFNEVKTKGALVGSTRTQEETDIKNLWLDVRYHIVWNIITRKIIETKRIDAWKTARLFALVHTTMADGASAMFDAKYYYYFWRPETAVRIADDGNPNTVNDPDWLPSGVIRIAPNPLMNFYTPTIPEYPSGILLGSITGKILQRFFESDQISIAISSLNIPGLTITYNSIARVVQDNNESKIYAGWYFRKSVEDGDEMGNQIATYAFDNFFRENDE